MEKWERSCDMCGKTYILNSEVIPRIIIRRKVILSDLLAKDSYANPDYCDNCTNRILDFIQKFRKLRFSVSNPQKNNYQLTKEELKLIR